MIFKRQISGMSKRLIPSTCPRCLSFAVWSTSWHSCSGFATYIHLHLETETFGWYFPLAGCFDAQQMSLSKVAAQKVNSFSENFVKMSFALKNVLITDEVDPKCKEILETNGIQVTFDTSLAKDKSRLIGEIPVS